jgi:aspartyl aminopeptidase
VSDAVSDLLGFIARSPTPYHAVAEAVRRLEACGFEALREEEPWSLDPGARRYAVRAGGSVVAFQVGSASPAEAGFRIVGAHTDSPNFRLKPRADVKAHGYRQLAVEPYGAVLLHSWLDRDLSIAGRVTAEVDGSPQTWLLDFARPLLRIPNLAIHLYRELREKGLALNEQDHLVPIVGLEAGPELVELVASELTAQGIAQLAADRVLAFDLMLYDVQPPSLSGSRSEFIHAPRLDNLASCHAAVCALERACAATPAAFTRSIALYDHEEVGSRSASGAAGPLLRDTLERVVSGFKGGAPQGLARAVSRSTLISADMAHAVHPNYADRHERGHRPVVGKGPVIKTHASQAYATDAEMAGLFASLCARVGIEPQHFVSRSDLPCGSTIGPITAARVGLRTVDVGSPMLSMHSCRELAGSADVAPMIDVLSAYFEGT